MLRDFVTSPPKDGWRVCAVPRVVCMDQVWKDGREAGTPPPRQKGARGSELQVLKRRKGQNSRDERSGVGKEGEYDTTGNQNLGQWMDSRK